MTNKTQTLEQWLDLNAPKWVQDTYRQQTQQILERLEVAEKTGREGDVVVESTTPNGELHNVHSPHGFPVPKEVAEDPSAKEILRIWKHADDSFSHAVAPYSIEKIKVWGIIFGLITKTIIGNKEDLLSVIFCGFAESTGIPFDVVHIRPDTGDDDPDKLLN